MKKEESDKPELTLATLAAEYSNEESARAFLEKQRWPSGIICPHCNNSGHYVLKPRTKAKTASRAGLYKCKTCWRQFTVTVGTIFADSKVPLHKWLMAFFILGSSKKAVSSHQLHRMLGVTYKTAWFMSHRIRHSMSPNKPLGRLLKGTVEVDETFFGKRSNVKASRSSKSCVAALVERGGEVRTRVIASVTQKNMGKCISEIVDKSAIINTDNHSAYNKLDEFKAHDVVSHSQAFSQPAPDGRTASINNCESFFSLMKRGMVGAFHHVSREHLPRYCDEFAFRWNTRKLTDGERFVVALGQTEGKRLKYRETITPA
jgi:transposase-like protein